MRMVSSIPRVCGIPTNSCASHKILDAIGDLALAGAPIMGRFVGHCSGHALNNVLLRELLHNENNWFLTTVRGAQSYFGWSGAIGTQAGG